MVRGERAQAGTMPGSRSAGRDGEHGGAGLLNLLNKQPAPQLARLPLGPSQPKPFGTRVIQARSSPACPSRGLGPIRRQQHLLLFVVVFTRWFFAGRRGHARKAVVAAGAGGGGGVLQRYALKLHRCGKTCWQREAVASLG